MHRFYITPSECNNRPLILNEAEAKHARSVLRIREGDRVIVLNGEGKEILCETQEVRNNSTKLKVIQENRIPPIDFEITLYQAITKGKTMDMIIQKATELGATRIVPVLSDRSVPDWDKTKSAAKIEKWKTVCIESIKQCGSAWIPKMELPMKVKEAINDSRNSEISLIATLQSDAKHPRVHIDSFHSEKGHKLKKIAIWIGPEGDYTPAEINTIRTSSLPISLGPLVLRSETAAIYCLAVLNYELQSQS